MAASTLTAVPSAVYAGDSLLWEIGLENYPASDGWVLTYNFRKENGSTIQFASTPNGANHYFSVSASITAGWTPGVYLGTSKVTRGVQSFTTWRGQIEILPDLSQQSDNYDTRSHAKKCLDAINAVLEGKATRDVMQTTIAGQSVGRMSWSEITAAKSYFQDLVDGESAAESAVNGLGNRRNILIRFGRP